MTVRPGVADPAEAAVLLVLVGGALGGFTILWIGRVLREVRRGREAVWLMRERLALWQRRAQAAAAEPVAGSGGAGPGPGD